MRVDYRTMVLLIGSFYVTALALLAVAALTDQRWAMMVGWMLAALGAVFHVAESLFTRDE